MDDIEFARMVRDYERAQLSIETETFRLQCEDLQKRIKKRGEDNGEVDENK